MYQKEPYKPTTKTKQIAFRGSFLMSPRLTLLREIDGVYTTRNADSQSDTAENRKNYILFSRN